MQKTNVPICDDETMQPAMVATISDDKIELHVTGGGTEYFRCAFRFAPTRYKEQSVRALVPDDEMARKLIQGAPFILTSLQG
jgi:hypothetical protein